MLDDSCNHLKCHGKKCSSFGNCSKLTSLIFSSHEIEKFARNTGLKLFRTSVKENLNVSKVFQYLAERHIESVSRWSDETAEDTFKIGGSGNNGIMSIPYNNGSNGGHVRDVRVRFSSSTENLDGGSGDNSGGSNSSVFSSYFHSRLLPLNGFGYNNSSSNGGSNNRRMNRKNNQQQQHQYQVHHQFGFVTAPASAQKNGGMMSNALLNPFRKQRGKNKRPPSSSSIVLGGHGHHHNGLALHHSHHYHSQFHQQPSKPSCRVL